MKPRHIILAMLSVLIMLALYVLSVGPAVLIHLLIGEPTRGASRMIEKAYAPIFWIADHSEQANSAYLWYIDKWLPPSEQSSNKRK